MTATIGQVVARNAKRLRMEQGATLEETGRAVRNLGISWSASRITAIEGGKRVPKLATLAILATALSCSIRDLVATEDDYVDLDGVLVTGEQLPQLFGSATPMLLPAGEPETDSEWAMSQGWPSTDSLLADVRASFEPWLSSRSELLTEDARGDREFWVATLQANLRHGDPEHQILSLAMIREVVGRSGLVEERTARQLGLHPVIVAAWSVALWGSTLAETRDRIAGEGAPDHERANVTAELRAELGGYAATLTPQQRRPTDYP